MFSLTSLTLAISHLFSRLLTLTSDSSLLMGLTDKYKAQKISRGSRII
jgi:hypothetical protein